MRKRQQTDVFPGSKGTVWSKLLKLLRMHRSNDVSKRNHDRRNTKGTRVPLQVSFHALNFSVHCFWLVDSSSLIVSWYWLNLFREACYHDHRRRGLPTYFQDHCSCLQTHQERSQCKLNASFHFSQDKVENVQVEPPTTLELLHSYSQGLS